MKNSWIRDFFDPPRIEDEPRKQPRYIWSFGILATYNSEVARGILHTDEWHEKMRVLQIRFHKSDDGLLVINNPGEPVYYG